MRNQIVFNVSGDLFESIFRYTEWVKQLLRDLLQSANEIKKGILQEWSQRGVKHWCF